MSLKYEEPENTHGKAGLHKGDRSVSFYPDGFAEDIIANFIKLQTNLPAAALPNAFSRDCNEPIGESQRYLALSFICAGYSDDTMIIN